MLLQGMETGDSAKIPHMRSQLLQWQGYLHALQGNTTEAVQAIQEAGSLRRQSGGPFYEVLYEIMAGAAYSRINMEHEGEALLNSSLAKARQIPSDYLTAAALMHRSWLLLQQDKTEEAENDLLQALALMRSNQYTFFWSWEPQFMLELLSFAARHDVETSFVNQLARQRLAVVFQGKGAALPLLSFSLLGSFQISTANGIHLKADNFTPAQRILLSLLLTSPGQSMDQESIQLVLWPDSSPDKARAKFDTLLTRMRKVLQTGLNVPAKNYLVLARGILSLQNCRIDAVTFEELARTGLKHAHAERYWQAGNTFYRALSLWKGPLEAESFMAGQTAKYYDQLISLLTRISHIWAVSLAESDNAEEAVTVLEKALRYNHMDDRLITLLYSLYLKSGNPLKAKETILNYRQVLQELDYDQDQIDELLFQVASKGA
jgi:DNA-binding SARP family transcriptional activator